MNQAERAQHLLKTLAALGHQSALVGGLAVSARTRPRFTRDIDFAVMIARGISILVARIPHIIAMKVLSESAVRDQDRSDLRVLLAAASARELDEAMQSVRLIEERGFDRGKDLQAVLESFRQDMCPQIDQDE